MRASVYVSDLTGEYILDESKLATVKVTNNDKTWVLDVNVDEVSNLIANGRLPRKYQRRQQNADNGNES